MPEVGIPNGSYMVLLTRQWVIVERGRAHLVSEYQIANGERVGRELRVKTPITDVTGTVEFL